MRFRLYDILNWVPVAMLGVLGLGAVPRVATAQMGSRDDRFPGFEAVLLVPTPRATPQPGAAPPPYPAPMREAGRQAYIVVAGVVDSLGALDPWSLSFLQLTDPAFRDPVCRWLARVKLEPYTDAGQLRRALVLIPLAFEIDDGRPAKGEPSLAGYERIIRSVPRDSVKAQLSSLPHCR